MTLMCSVTLVRAVGAPDADAGAERRIGGVVDQLDVLRVAHHKAGLVRVLHREADHPDVGLALDGEAPGIVGEIAGRIVVDSGGIEHRLLAGIGAVRDPGVLAPGICRPDLPGQRIQAAAQINGLPGLQHFRRVVGRGPRLRERAGIGVVAIRRDEEDVLGQGHGGSGGRRRGRRRRGCGGGRDCPGASGQSCDDDHHPPR